jgi:hypothetical protein
LPFDQRHPHRLAGVDLGEEGGHGRVGLAPLFLPQRGELLLGQRLERWDLDRHSCLRIVSLMGGCKLKRRS